MELDKEQYKYFNNISAGKLDFH